MAHKFFFSWQGDTPNSCGRSFVQAALQDALTAIHAEGDVDPARRDEDLLLDHDTKGVSGTPPIVDTIFKKIDRAAGFIADLTLVCTRLDAKRRSPNPNVLIEYGWALKTLGHQRVICVVNTYYGAVSDDAMPFDMRHLRKPITYNLAPDADSAAKKAVRKELTKVFGIAIADLLGSDEFLDSLPKAPAVAAFPRNTPKKTQSRFRAPGSELGLGDTGFLAAAGKPIRLTDGPGISLRVMPGRDPGRKWSCMELRRLLVDGKSLLMPLAWSAFGGCNFVRADDGFGMTGVSTEEGFTSGVGFAFTTGEIWSVNSVLLSHHAEIPFLEDVFADAFVRYVSALRDGLEIPTPYSWIAGIEQVKGRRLNIGPAPAGQRWVFPSIGSCSSDDVSFEGTYEDGSSPNAIELKPFFELLHDRCGVERSAHHDAALLRER